MPSIPNLDGLPIGIQITITVMFGLAALLVAGKGYFKEGSTKGAAMVTADEQTVKQVQTAAIVDMAVVRNLTETIGRLDISVESLDKSIREILSWKRVEHEIQRELCQRLREVKEQMEDRHHGR